MTRPPEPGTGADEGPAAGPSSSSPSSLSSSSPSASGTPGSGGRPAADLEPGSAPAALPVDPTVPVAPTVPSPVVAARGPSEVALGAVLLVVLVGLAFVGQDHWRRGLLLTGVGLVAGAVARLVLPARLAGLLAVRGRVFDAIVLGGLGVAVIVLTTSVPLPAAG